MSFFWENGLQIFYKRSIPPPAKYHGLINQGATCYLNSVLQVLFMTKDFREAVERHTNETPGPIDHHLKQLFKDLIGHKAYTNNITKTLGIDRVYEQRDAAEYIEKILRLTSPEASQIFHGLLTYKNICSQCHTENDNDERFWHLPLALMDSCGKEDYSVVNGIEAYFRPSVFSGENQMYCEECDAKSDATNKCVIKHHPEVLILLLKRFEFDYSHMTYVKIYCTVDVPHTLQIPENQTYELYAVVDHLGDLRSGHYTATIKDDESWYRFNDDKVTLLDYQPCQVDNSEKFRDAYLLFYRKTNDTEDIGEVSTPGGFPPATSDINEQRQEAGKIREREEVEGASVEDQENEGFVDVRQDISEDLRGTQRTKSTNKKHEQQGKEKMDVKRDKEQNRGDDNGQDVEDQNNEGLDEIRQNQSEQKITDTHSGHKDVCVEKQAKEQDDEHIQNRADSSVRQAGSSGSRSLTENQEVSSVEKTRHGDPQPRGVGRSPEPSFNVEDQNKQVYARNSKPINHLGKIMTDLNPRTGFNENTIKGRRNPEQSRPGGNVKRKSDPKINAEVTLSESVCNMKRSEETSQEPQKHQTKSFTGNTQEEIETHSTVDPNARTKRKVSDTQEQDAEIKHEKKKRKWWHLPALKKKQRKEKNKHKKPVGCFSFSCKSKNNADPTSESD